MSALRRKMLRDLWQMKSQALAISLVLGSGVAMFVAYQSALDSLRFSLATYYERYRFADVFGAAKRAPASLRERIAEIPGVTRVATRVAVDVTLDVPGFPEPVSGRLLSIPERSSPGLNALHLRSGRMLAPGREDEVLASEAFAEAHRLKPDDALSALINGRRRRLQVVGIALSPEHIYSIKGGDFLPDDQRYGVFWMGEKSLASAFNMEGAFNDVAIELARGASEKEVIARLDPILAPYGGVGAYGRREQVSNWFLMGELDQLRAVVRIVPAIFLSVAAFLLNVVLSRLIGTQREQIAALKAFGYSNRAVAVHYLELVSLIGIGGAVGGAAAGAWMGHGITRLYTHFFRFPLLDYVLRPRVVIVALLLTSGAALAGALGAVRRAVRLPPAEAMRPEAPARYRPTVIERLGLRSLFSQPTRMILRHLERRPVKATLSALGIALAVAILIVGRFSVDAMNSIMDFEFGIAQREDVSVSFVETRPARALQEIEHFPGVVRAERFRAVPVRLRHENRSRRLALFGLDRDAELRRVIDVSRRPVRLPEEGVVLTGKLAETLGARAGDRLEVDLLDGTRRTRVVLVSALVEQYLGLSAYMELGALHRLLQEGPHLSGAFLEVDLSRASELYSWLKATPGVAGVAVKKASLESFQKTLAENLLRFTFFNVLFASIIAFGVVYNTARIALSERARELASLRVLGLTRGEISYILLGELAVLTLVALPLGLLLGTGLAALTTRLFETEVYRIPLVIHRSTYAFSVLVVLLAALVSGLVVRRRLDQLDLVAVLKTRE